MRRPAIRLAAALALLGLAGPALASPCWAPATMGAARISELNTLLMASNLRCKRVGVNFADSYEKVLVAHGAAFRAAEARLRAHFGVDHSDSADDYDSYVVSIANHYGGGRADPGTCAQLGTIAAALAAAPGNADLLATIAIQMIRDPHTGQRCSLGDKARPAAGR
ncbi:hypothetical protein ACFOON_09280 [Novosphingobium piscinae]|uniref:S-adenosyl-L-homocysteine hydrolase n=1 Tax=Novosphingobium piscinae TaxID=1507448 RepID=A0A7X1FY84_9SPHN|nr:hypothetical protein [Novosphingobium piscinae]MBC2669153.1 hypothetical protein [Novosphingobium piscinae]